VKGDLRASAIFSDGLLAGKRFTPAQLEHLTRNSAAIIRRKANARRFLKIMNSQHAGLNYGRTISDIDARYGQNVYYDGKNPAYFLARYAFDGKYQNEVHLYAAVLWAHALTGRNSRGLARTIEKLAKDAGVDLYAILPENEKVTLQERLKRLKTKTPGNRPGILRRSSQTAQPAKRIGKTQMGQPERPCMVWATRKKCLMRKRVCVEWKTVRKCTRYNSTNFYTRKCIRWDSHPLCIKRKNKCIQHESNRYCKKWR
jgi:hypothetical protein